jgi:AAA family ATPase
LGSARTDDLAHSGVLTSLLNEMDGIEELSGVTVVAATNRPDVLVSHESSTEACAKAFRTPL